MGLSWLVDSLFPGHGQRLIVPQSRIIDIPSGHKKRKGSPLYIFLYGASVYYDTLEFLFCRKPERCSSHTIEAFPQKGLHQQAKHQKRQETIVLSWPLTVSS